MRETTQATQVAEIISYPRNLVRQNLGLGKTRFASYLNLLNQYCQSEFGYSRNQRVFSGEQYRMLKRLRELFLQPPEGSGLIEAQVIDILLTKGI